MAIFSGDIFAEQYVISSSVTNVTIGSVSGSTAFGDSSDDTHQFTGSILLNSSQGDLKIGYTPGGSPSGIRFYNDSNNYHFYTTSDRIFTAKTDGITIDDYNGVAETINNYDNDRWPHIIGDGYGLSVANRSSNTSYGDGAVLGVAHAAATGRHVIGVSGIAISIQKNIGGYFVASGSSNTSRAISVFADGSGTNIGVDASGMKNGFAISGSATSTGSFGKLTIGTGDVYTDVSSSAASFLTIDTKAGNYATASAIWIKGTSHINRLRINFDNKSSGTPYSAIEGTTQGGGAGRGELRFYTRNAEGRPLNPRLLIGHDGAAAFYQGYGSGDPPRLTTFTSASLAVFGSNTNFQKPWAIFAENRSSNAGRGGLFISAYADNSEEAIIRAANNYNDGTIFEVTANKTQHKISGSATSTGSFGSLQVSDAVQGQLKLKGYYTSTIHPYIKLQPNGSNSIFAFDGNNAAYIRSLSGFIFERRNDSTNQFYRYHAYFEHSTGRSYFGGSTMIHTNGSVTDAGDPKALLHVSGGNFYVEGGNISGSATSTGSFAHIRGGGGTTTDNQTKVSFEISSRKKYGENAMYDVSLVDGNNRKSVFSAHSGSSGYYSYIGNQQDGYAFGYKAGWTGRLYMQSQEIAYRNAGANQIFYFSGTGGIGVNKISLSNQVISASSAAFDFYTYGGGKFDIRSYYNETFQFRVNSGTAAAPEYATRMIFGNRAGGGKIGLGGVTNPTEAVHIGAGSNLRNTGSFGDVRLYVDGNISGSATSTGSFARLAVGRGNTNSSYASTTGGDVAFGVDASGKRIILRASHVEIGSDDYWGINAFTKDSDATLFLRQGMHIFTSGNNQGMRIYNTYGSSYNSYVERAGNSWLGTSLDGGHLVLRNYGSGGTQVWHGDNVVVDVKASATGSSTLLTLEDNKISGSSTSTGSFGTIHTPELIGTSNLGGGAEHHLYFGDVLQMRNRPGSTDSVGIGMNKSAGSNDLYVSMYNYGGGNSYVKTRTTHAGYPYYQWQAGLKYWTMYANRSTGAESLALISGSISKVNTLKETVWVIDQNTGENDYTDGLSIKYSGNAQWRNRTTGAKFFEINETNKLISGSAISTGSFGTLKSANRLTIDVPNDVGGSTTQGIIDINEPTGFGDAYLLTYNNQESDFHIWSDQGRMKFYSSPAASYDGTGQAAFIFQGNMDDDGAYLIVGNGNSSNVPLTVKPNMISGSAATTGSFGRVEVTTLNVTSTGSFGGGVIAGSQKNAGTNGIGEYTGPNTGFTLAAGASKNIYIGTGAALIIIHFNGAGPGALCFTTWTGTTVTELSDPSSYVEITDTGSKLAVYKSGDGDYFTIKNRSGGTYTLNITLVGASQT